jgi:LEA14-like dessication related protein
MKKNTLRNILLAFVLCLAIAGAWMAWRASHNEHDFHFKPDVIIKGIAIEDDNDEILKVYATVNILNDLPLEARVRSLEYTLAHQGTIIARNLSRDSLTIRSRDTTQVTLAFRIGKAELQILTDKLEAADSDVTQFALELFFKLDVPVRGYRDFEITKEIEVPVIRLPIVESRKVEIEKFSLSHPELQMELLVRNPNSFPLILDDCEFSMIVADDLNLTGNSDGVQRVSANSSEMITFRLQVEDLKLMKVAWKALFREDKTQFTSKFSFRIVSENKVIDGSHWAILRKGMLGELKSK